MSAQNYTRFLSECSNYDPASASAVPDDEIYGVYVSWCNLNGEEPGASQALWDALTRQGHARRPGSVGRRWPGLFMRGPAVVDYILSSQPSLVCAPGKGQL